MDFRTLKELVKQGEGKRLEFKLKSNHPERIVRELVAFANSDGGKLLIGVDDDRTIKGLKYAEEDEYLLIKAIEKYISPALDCAISYVPIGDERSVLVFAVESSPNRPHYVVQTVENSTQPLRKAYVRVADKSVQASWEMREILRRGRNNRDVRFQYGDKEQKLVQYLGENKNITVEGFAKIASIPKKIASKTLVLLVLANVLVIQPDEVVDKFSILNKP